MNSKSHRLEELVARWHDAPRIGAVMAAADGLLHDDANIAGRDFNTLVTVTTKHLLRAMNEVSSSDVVCLGRGLSWLSRLGLLEELQIACKRNDSGAQTAVVQALRDACCEQVERAHQQWLLLTVTPMWEDRVAVAEEWLKTDGVQPMFAPWELAESLPDVIEAIGAQERLAISLRPRDAHYS